MFLKFSAAKVRRKFEKCKHLAKKNAIFKQKRGDCLMKTFSKGEIAKSEIAKTGVKERLPGQTGRAK